VSPEAGAVMVPALLLQPLVENAVRHGIAGLVDGGNVNITAERIGDAIVIVVENPRDPDARGRKGTGLGLDIVRRRLRAAFGAEASMTVEATEHSYCVVVTVPHTGAADRSDNVAADRPDNVAADLQVRGGVPNG